MLGQFDDYDTDDFSTSLAPPPEVAVPEDDSWSWGDVASGFGSLLPGLTQGFANVYTAVVHDDGGGLPQVVQGLPQVIQGMPQAYQQGGISSALQQLLLLQAIKPQAAAAPAPTSGVNFIAPVAVAAAVIGGAFALSKMLGGKSRGGRRRR